MQEYAQTQFACFTQLKAQWSETVMRLSEVRRGEQKSFSFNWTNTEIEIATSTIDKLQEAHVIWWLQQIKHAGFIIE